MAGKKGVIETGVDKLVSLVHEQKKISVKDAAKELGVSIASIEEWADFLEEAGLITVQTKFATIYLIEKQLSEKEVMAKLKEMKSEKESFLRRAESSLNSIDRDREEIKLIGSEFDRIQSLLGRNFAALQKKLDTLDDFRKSRSYVDVKEKDIERKYDKKLSRLDSRLRKEQSAYDSMLKKVDDELSRIKSEAGHLDGLKSSQKELRDKVSAAHKMLLKVEAELDKESKGISEDENRLSASRKSAEKLKEEVLESASDLKAVTESLRKSRGEFEQMEKGFREDLKHLLKGDLDKVEAYKQSKRIMDRFQKFLSKSKEMKSVINEAEKEGAELKKHFESVAKKAQALQVVAKSSGLKKDIAALSRELSEIEKEKGDFSAKLRKLRLFMRSVVK